MQEIEQSGTLRKKEVEQTTLLNGNVKLGQPMNGLRAGIDAVFLAASVPMHSGQKGLDLGCGVGSVGLCVMNRVPDTDIMAIEIQDGLAELARQNARQNNRDTYQVVKDDFRNVKGNENTFDHVFLNPPFLESGTYLRSPDLVREQAIGNEENKTTLEEWLDFASRHLKPKGMLSVIHRTDALQNIVNILGVKFGAVEIIPLFPKQGRSAKRVIVRAVKGSKSPSKVHCGIILHNEDGSYTEHAQHILIQGQGI